MRISKIRKELGKIYKERNSWDGGKGPFTESAIRRRELILMKQQILYRTEEAKLTKNKVEESFYLDLYKVVNDYLEELQ